MVAAWGLEGRDSARGMQCMESRDAAHILNTEDSQPLKQGITGFRESSVLRLTNLDGESWVYLCYQSSRIWEAIDRRGNFGARL